MKTGEFAERTVAALALVVAAPLLAIVAAAVWVEDGSPVLFRQQRVGKNGTSFHLIKFRSMRQAAGAQITASGDSRITSVGLRLRKYKLDELPQLWNVVRGDMSLVGPRPEVAHFVNLGDPAWAEVLSVKPGITCATTLLLRNEEAILAGQSDPERFYREQLLPAKLRLERAQIRARSGWSDFVLIAVSAYYSAFPSRFDMNFVKRRFLAEDN